MTPLENQQWSNAILLFTGLAMIISAMPKPIRVGAGLIAIAFIFWP